jgi:hypothetical protein
MNVKAAKKFTALENQRGDFKGARNQKPLPVKFEKAGADGFPVLMRHLRTVKDLPREIAPSGGQTEINPVDAAENSPIVAQPFLTRTK